MMYWSYFCIPLLAALIGWGTNVLAVKMLFHPKKPINLGFMTISGVIPRRQKAMADAIAQIFEEELLSLKDLLFLIESVDIEGHGSQLVDEGIDRFVVRMKAKIPMAGMFLTGPLLADLKAQAKEEFIKVLPDLKEHIKSHMNEHLSIQDFIADKIRAFSPDKLEHLVMKVAKKELSTVERLGGVLGFLVGLIQVLLMCYIY